MAQHHNPVQPAIRHRNEACLSWMEVGAEAVVSIRERHLSNLFQYMTSRIKHTHRRNQGRHHVKHSHICHEVK